MMISSSSMAAQGAPVGCPSHHRWRLF